MEQLEKLFGDRALTYEELIAQLQQCTDIKLVDVSKGDYVEKVRYEELESQLKEVRAERDADAKALGEQLDAQKKDAAIALALTRAQAKNLTAAKALLNLEQIALEDGQIAGLEPQLETVMRENPFLFGGAPNPPPPAGKGLGFAADDAVKWRLEAGLPACEQ